MHTPSHSTLAIVCFTFGLILGVTTLTIGAGSRGSDQFQDVPLGAYFDDAVGEMAAIGVLRGRPDGRFDPGAFATRAEIAVMLQRLRNDILGIAPPSSSLSSSRSSRSSSSSTTSTTSTSSTTSSSSSSRSSAFRNPAGTIRFTTDHFTATEEQGTVSLTIVRTGGADGAVFVSYAIADGTAKAGKDYVAASGKISFADGETTRTITVDVINNTESDGGRSFSMEISAPEGGASLGVPASATVIISDDDGAPASGDGTSAPAVFRFSALQYSVAENGGSVAIMVERTGGSTGAASVQYKTSDGTAKVTTSDYVAAIGTLQFAAGETEKSFTVTVNDDSNKEGNEKVNLALSAPTGGPTVDAARGTVELTIVDDETIAYGTGSLRFTKETADVSENAGELILTIERIGGAKGNVTVDCDTVNGLAKAGEDFEKIETVLTFRDGETKKTIAVKIFEDTKQDPNESFSVEISNPTHGAAIIPPEKVRITIIE